MRILTEIAQTLEGFGEVATDFECIQGPLMLNVPAPDLAPVLVDMNMQRTMVSCPSLEKITTRSFSYQGSASRPRRIKNDTIKEAGEIGSYAFGRVKWKLEPRPTVLSAQTRPLWAWTMCLTRARPRPTPSVERERSAL